MSSSDRRKFEKFARFHNVPSSEWDDVYESGLDHNRDWEQLMHSVMYCPKANYHLFDDITCEMGDEPEFNKRIKAGAIDTSPFKRGDIIQCYGSNEDGNVGKLIWNGKKAVRFDCNSLTDYGTIPFEFAVCKEFPVNYWNDPKLQNYMNAAPVNFGKRVAKQLDAFIEKHLAAQEDSDCGDAPSYDFVFTFQGQKWMYNYDPDLDDRPIDENGKGHVLYEELGAHIMGNWYHISPFYKSYYYQSDDEDEDSDMHPQQHRFIIPPENILTRYTN